MKNCWIITSSGGCLIGLVFYNGPSIYYARNEASGIRVKRLCIRGAYGEGEGSVEYSSYGVHISLFITLCTNILLHFIAMTANIF